MRILWIPGNGAIYNADNKYNGGGWTGALAQELMTRVPDLELGMAIPWKCYFEDVKDGVKIYGIPPIKHGFICYQRKLKRQVEVLQNIVEDFRPDLIHVFGSEHTGGMVATVTDIPVVLHLQGILNFLKESWLPQNMSWEKYYFWNPRQWFEKRNLLRACETEQRILSACRYLMGRTEMDKRVSRILSPNSTYYYCSEMLRPEIYNSDNVWNFHARVHHVIVSVISSPLYKGSDILLRIANVLKIIMNIDFEWRVYGVYNLSEGERLSGIVANDVNVNICGIVNASQLREILMDSDVFVHPSYIDNSPNTVCEAQLIGVPVVANYVGGIPSLISNMVDGILIPPSDIYMAASYISELLIDRDIACRLGSAGRKTALCRHNPKVIVENVLDIYKKMISYDIQ